MWNYFIIDGLNPSGWVLMIYQCAITEEENQSRMNMNIKIREAKSSDAKVLAKIISSANEDVAQNLI